MWYAVQFYLKLQFGINIISKTANNLQHYSIHDDSEASPN